MIVTITDDFDLDRIAGSGQCFRWEKVDPKTYRIIAGAACLYIKSTDQDYYDLDCTEEEYSCFWKDYFDLHENYSRIRDRIDRDEDSFLWHAANNEKGIRILRQNPWEMLVTFIISQNKNIPAIRNCIELLARACGEKKSDSRGREYYAFPGPAAVAALSEQDLISCKLGYRWKYVQAAANAIACGRIDLNNLYDADENTTTDTLTTIYGVGMKVADCVSLFGLHHINAFPIDTWIKRVLSEQYPDGYPYEKYSPYNGIFQQYMFAYYRHR